MQTCDGKCVPAPVRYGAVLLLAACAVSACQPIGHPQAAHGARKPPPVAAGPREDVRPGGTPANAPIARPAGLRDPLVWLAPPGNAPSGTLVYPAILPPPRGSRAGDRTFIVVRRVGGVGAGARDVTAYQALDKPEWMYIPQVFMPELSADGHQVLFRDGDLVEDHSEHQVRLLDLRTSRARTVVPADGIHYPGEHLSPDGKYLSYNWGGDRSGDEQMALGDSTDWAHWPWMSLRVLDLRTNKSVLVARDTSATNAAWSPPASLYFAATFPSIRGPRPAKRLGGGWPAIWRWLPRDPTPRLVVREAMGPVPSPNQRWLGFLAITQELRHKDAEEVAEYRQSGAKGMEGVTTFGRIDNGALLIAAITRMDGAKRRPLGITIPSTTPGATMRWTPDSRTLIVLGESGPKDGVSTGTIYAVSMRDRRPRSVARITTTAYGQSRDFCSNLRQRFRLVSVSPDGAWVCVASWTITGDGRLQIDQLDAHVLWAVNLQTGKVVRFAELRGNNLPLCAEDWRFDQPAPRRRGARAPNDNHTVR